MRQLGLGLLLLLALGAASLAAPMLDVDAPVYDFGTATEGAVINHAFVLTNQGDEALVITGTRATCGCTTTALAKSSLAPGESVSLEARVDTSNFGGQRIAKQIYVESNDPIAPTAVLSIQGDVTALPPYNITPSDLKYLFLLIVDVRDASAYAAGHLLGAVNIPSAHLPLWTGVLPKDVILVLYDDNGQDSGAQAQYLRSVGFPEARSLAGGFEAWSALPNAGDYVVGALPAMSAQGPSAVQAHEIPNGDLRSIYFVVIDLRTPSDYADPRGHFLGAMNIPTDDFASWETRLPKDAEIVLYDQTGEESDRWAKLLQDAGLAKVHGLAGGYDAWTQLYGITYLIAERP